MGILFLIATVILSSLPAAIGQYQTLKVEYRKETKDINVKLLESQHINPSQKVVQAHESPVPTLQVKQKRDVVVSQTQTPTPTIPVLLSQTEGEIEIEAKAKQEVIPEPTFVPTSTPTLQTIIIVPKDKTDELLPPPGLP